MVWMSKENLIPDIRINGYEKEWDIEKLENVASFSKGKGYTKSDLREAGTPIIQYGSLYTNYQCVKGKENIDTFVEEKPNSVISEGDEVILPSSGETALEIAIASVVKDKGIILGGDLNIIKLKEKIYPLFLALSLSNGRTKLELANLAEGVSIVHLHNSEIKQMEIVFPTIKEQQKVADLFYNFDNVILIQQRLIDTMKQYKKSMLTKLFPKSGKSSPEFRFKGFSEDWQLSKIGDCFSERTERSPEGELLSITIDSGIIKSSDLDKKDNSSTDKSNYKIVKKNDIAYNSMRMWQGACGLSSYNGIVSPAYTILIPNKISSSLFFSYYFKTQFMIYQFAANSQGLTSDQWNLKYPILKDVKIRVPAIDEQQKIGSFLKTLEKKIDLEEQKLESYKDLKQALLQRMFI